MEKILFKKENLLPYIENLCKKNFDEKIIEIKCLGGGSYGLAFDIKFINGYNIIIKALKIREMVDSEAESLRLLKKASPLKIPEVYFINKETDDIPINAIGMERIEGVNALSSPLFLLYSSKKRNNFANIITVALGEIHKCKGDSFGFIKGDDNAEKFDKWQDFYFTLANDTYEKAKAFHSQNKLKPKIFFLLEKGMEKFNYIFSENVEKPTLLHGDLNILNIIVNKKTFEPTGIIDPFNSMWGDIEYDLFQFNTLFPSRFPMYEMYKEKFKTSELIDLKCAFYALINEVLCHMKSGMYSTFLYKVISSRLIKQYKIHGIKW